MNRTMNVTAHVTNTFERPWNSPPRSAQHFRLISQKHNRYSQSVSSSKLRYNVFEENAEDYRVAATPDVYGP